MSPKWLSYGNCRTHFLIREMREILGNSDNFAKIAIDKTQEEEYLNIRTYPNQQIWMTCLQGHRAS